MVNVIIPHYNSTKTIEKTLYSLAAQTKEFFMVTVVDDKSKEEELVRLKEIIQFFSGILNIKLIERETNGGPGMARQTGIDSESMCDYLIFLDSDDELYPDAVERLYREAKVNDADLVISDIHMESKVSKGSIFRFGDNTTWFHGKIYKRNFLDKYGIRFTEEMRDLFLYNEDCYFNLLCVWLAEKKFNLEETTYLWRNNQNSITRQMNMRDFYYKYNKDYFNAQACALLSAILSYPERKFLIGPTVSSLYEAYQIEALKNPQNVESFSNILLDIFEEPAFREKFYTPRCLAYIANETEQGKTIEKDILFFPESFANWAKRHGLGMGGEI